MIVQWADADLRVGAGPSFFPGSEPSSGTLVQVKGAMSPSAAGGRTRVRNGVTGIVRLRATSV